MSNKKKIIAISLGLVSLVVIYLVFESIYFVSTDNATIQGHSLLISSKVPGVVTDVLVDENQKVKEGDVLVRLDARDYQNQLALAEAEVGSSDARLKDNQTNFNRIKSLFAAGAVTQQQFDTAQTLLKTETKKNAAVQAQLEQAKLNIAYTEIKAPANGIIAKRSVEKGQVLPAGQAILGFISSESRWIIANYKETDLKRIQVGAEAKISVDALPNLKLKAVVDSISPSTGATFTLLPPDNATGNFTKVVQRIPIKLKILDLKTEDVDRLQVGLSVIVDLKSH